MLARRVFLFSLSLSRKSERRETRESGRGLKNRGNKAKKKATGLIIWLLIHTRLDHLLSRFSLSRTVVVPLLISLLLTDK